MIFSSFLTFCFSLVIVRHKIGQSGWSKSKQMLKRGFQLLIDHLTTTYILNVVIFIQL